VPCVKKLLQKWGTSTVYENGMNIQQFQTGWWDGDNFIPLAEVASFQASKFHINMFKQNNVTKHGQTLGTGAMSWSILK
jgi:hypothetical protein